jgi:hypothetical protein
MTRKQKIQNLLSRLDALKPKELNESVQGLLREESESIKADRPSMKAIQQIADEVVKVKKDPRIQGLTKTVTKVREENLKRIEDVSNDFAEKVESLLEELRQTETRGTEMTSAQIEDVLTRFTEYQDTFEEEKRGILNNSSRIESEVNRLGQELAKVSPRLESTFRVNLNAQGARINGAYEAVNTVRMDVVAVEKKIEELRKSFLTRISSFEGGGNQNRNIGVNGNSSTLSKFTDINLIAGSNIGIAVSTNNTTKETNLTFTASVPVGGVQLFASVSGTVDGMNTTFGYPSPPQAIVGDGIVYFEGNGYSYAASVITMEMPPSQYIKTMP